MLVLSRKKNEEIVIEVAGEIIVVSVVELRGDKCRVGVLAARHIAVHRREVYDAIHAKGDEDGN